MFLLLCMVLRAGFERLQVSCTTNCAIEAE